MKGVRGLAGARRDQRVPGNYGCLPPVNEGGVATQRVRAFFTAGAFLGQEVRRLTDSNQSLLALVL